MEYIIKHKSVKAIVIGILSIVLIEFYYIVSTLIIELFRQESIYVIIAIPFIIIAVVMAVVTAILVVCHFQDINEWINK